MLSGKVDATLGAFWNYEGVDLAAARPQDPVIQRMEELGVPTYAELVLRRAARATSTRTSPRKVRRFMQATARGHEALDERPGGRARRRC